MSEAAPELYADDKLALIKEQVDFYKVPDRAIEIVQTTPMVFLVGITAAGKGTIIEELKKTGEFHEIISHTTRQPRINNGIPEEDGVHYHFVDLHTVGKMIENEGFVEVKVNHKNVYGTSVAEVQLAHDEGKIALCDVDIKGVEEYHEISSNIIPVFVLPPNFETWMHRIQARHAGHEMSDEEKAIRIETARFELSTVLSRDYFNFVINDNLDEAVSMINKLAHGEKMIVKNKSGRAVASQLLKRLEQSVS